MKLSRWTILACALLGSCAFGPTESDCRAMNWEMRGHDDAMFYDIAPQIDDYVRLCRAFGVEPDADAYMEGWRDGYTERDASM